MERWKTIKQLFQLTSIEDETRKAILEHLAPYLDAIFSRFYEKLLQDKNVKRFISLENIPRLLKAQKEFITFLFSAPIDQHFYDKIVKVGQLHYRIGLQPSYLAYGFYFLTTIIYEIANKDTFLQKQLCLILKFFKIAELIMDVEYFRYSEFRATQKEHLLNILNDLYLGFKAHQNALNVVKKLWLYRDKRKFLEVLQKQDVPLSIEKCIFAQKVKQAQTYKILGLDLQVLQRLQQRWFERLNTMVKAIENDDEAKLKEVYDDLLSISENISNILNKPLQEISSTLFLAVNSGVKFLHHIAEMLYKRERLHTSREEELKAIEEKTLDVLYNSLAWAIEKADYELKPLKEETYDILKQITIVSLNQTIYIGVKLKELPYKLYLKELVDVLLEIIKLLIFLKEREYDLIELADRAEAANRAKDMFLASMSHELRTPLNAIIGFAQILEMKKDVPETIKPYIEKIHIAGKNLLTLVNTILDFAKLEAGKIQVKPEEVDIGNILNEVVTIISPLVRQKKLELHYPKNLSIVLFVDPKLIKEVFLNLLSNAIKFTPEGGKIWIKADFLSKDKAYMFGVCDTGIGIKNEDIFKLFNPFTQLENPFQKTVKGTGLGLAIVKKIIELHKGQVWVESEYQKGACFYFTIPVNEKMVKVEVMKTDFPEAKKILVVEDAEVDVKLLKNCLQNKHYLFITNAVNKGREILENENIDAIILDYYLIDGVGTELIDFLKHHQKNIPIVLLSAEDDVSSLSEIKQTPQVKKVIIKGKTKDVCLELTKFFMEQYDG